MVDQPPIAVARGTISAGRPEAAMAVWPWRQAAAAHLEEIVESKVALRRAGILQALVGGAISTLAWILGHPTVALVAGSLAALTLVAALLSPTGLYAQIRRGLVTLGGWIGRLLTVVLLTPLFFGFFALFGKLRRRGTRDRLQRHIEPGAPSYWQRRDDPEPSREGYERQF